MSKITNSVQELKNLGFSEEQIEEILKIAEQDMLDTILEDFAFNAKEEVVQEYTKKFEESKSDSQKLTLLMKEIMEYQYGKDNIEKKKAEFFDRYLEDVLNLAKETKDLYNKYSQGDQETLQAVEETKKSPVTQHYAKKIEELMKP